MTVTYTCKVDLPTDTTLSLSQYEVSTCPSVGLCPFDGHVSL